MEPAETGPPGQTQPKPNNQRPPLKIVLSLTLTAVILGGLYYWVFKYNRVSTDNAYASADAAQISSRVPGTIVAVRVENDTPVQTGDVLIELDRRDYQVDVDKAAAAVAQLTAEIEAARVSIALTDRQSASQLDAARAQHSASQQKEREVRFRIQELEERRAAVDADLKHAEREFDRFSNLYREGSGSERQRDQASTALKKVRAEMGAIEAEMAAVRASLAGVGDEVGRAGAQAASAEAALLNTDLQRHRLVSLEARQRSARAELEEASLNLSYCTILAPIGGYVAQKHIQVGQRVQPGQPLLAVVPLHDVFVEANFKETQLVNVRIGQPARIIADIYPGREYRGKVIGIRAGTGAAFSLLPAENATGNWIKVVQRVPVKIRLDQPPPPTHPLRVGLSLEVVIDTSDRSGGVLVTQAKP